MARKPKDETEAEEFGAGLDENEIVDSVVAMATDDLSVELTEKEKLQLEAEARKEVIAAMKAAKAKDFKAAAKKRIQSETMFRTGKDDSGEDMDTVDLVLASYPKYIMLDGTVYHSGRRYTKKKSVIAVLKDQMARGWQQEAGRRGEKIAELQPIRSMQADGLRYN